jgi:metal-sulfur cluster biosynthetic enzyme
MDMTKDAVFRALRTVNYPGFSRDIVSFGLVHGVLMEGTTARIGLVTANLPRKYRKR